MALHAGERVLSWVDDIISRMVYCFSCSCYVSPAPARAAGGHGPSACVCGSRRASGPPVGQALRLCGGGPGPRADAALTLHGQDNILKTSFLSAAVMLTKALKQGNRSQSYKFTQIPELIRCLLVSDPWGPAAAAPRASPRDTEDERTGPEVPAKHLSL